MLKVFIFVFLAFNLFVGCQNNILKDMSNQTSNDAYVNDAIKALDSKDYDTAISILTTKIASDYRTNNEIRRLTAEAYAGKCGLDTLSYFTGLGNGVTALFKIFYQPLVGVPVTPLYCNLATAKMLEIGSVSTRTASDNTFLTVVNMARIGAVIQSALDTSPAGGDGTMEATACGMTNAQIDEVILGLGYVIENITYVSASLVGSSATSALNGLTGICQAAGATCTVTDPAMIDNNLRNTFRDLLNTSDFGVGSVATGGNVVAIGLACP